jgi:hypothetical protein
VRGAIETAVEMELAATLGAGRYERRSSRQGYRDGTKTRTLHGPTGALALTLPRGTVTTAGGQQEWTSTLVPRCQRRLAEVNTAVLATYLAGGTRSGSGGPWRRCCTGPRCRAGRCRGSRPRRRRPRRRPEGAGGVGPVWR